MRIGTRRRRIAAAALLAGALAAGCGASPGSDPAGRAALTVSAASDLALALREIADRYERESGSRVHLNLGATGQLAQQIAEGAPVDLFLAADSGFVRELADRGRLLPDTRATYARGRLVLWSRAARPVPIERLEDLARPDVRRVAIANPEHAPYGRAAREALRAAGLWERVRPKLVYGENVRQALQHAEMGNADAALAAHALALQLPGHRVPVPAHLHPPLEQQLAIVRGSPGEEQARALARWILGPEGRRILAAHGFLLPDAVPAASGPEAGFPAAVRP